MLAFVRVIGHRAVPFSALVVAFVVAILLHAPPAVNAARPCERLPVEPTDIFFLADTTSSMGSAIESLQQQISPMYTSLRNSINDLRVGAAEYRDHTSTIPYRINLALGDNSGPQLATALQQWAPIGGGDTREAQIYALYQLARRTDWGPGRIHIIVWFSDAPGHDPSAGVSKSQAIAALQAAGIRVIAIDTEIMNYENQAVSITSATGGYYTQGEQSDMGELVEIALFDVLVDVAFPGGFPPPAEPDRRLCGWHERTGTIPPTRSLTMSVPRTPSATVSESLSATESPRSSSNSGSASASFSQTASASSTGPTASLSRLTTGTGTLDESDTISTTLSAAAGSPSVTATANPSTTPTDALTSATSSDGVSATSTDRLSATVSERLTVTLTSGTDTDTNTATPSFTASASGSRAATATGATTTRTVTASTGTTSYASQSATKTVTVTTPATVSFTPIPPRPVPVVPAVVAVARDIATVADASSEVTTTTVAGATGAATVATHMSRLASLRQSLTCQDAPSASGSETDGNGTSPAAANGRADASPEGQLPPAQHPLRFAVPAAGPGATYRAGAILGELAITLGVAVVVCLVVAPIRWQMGLRRAKRQALLAAHAAFDDDPEARSDHSGAARKTYRRALAWCRFPGCMVVVLALVAPRIAESSAAVFLAPGVSMTGYAIAGVGGVIALLLISAVAVAHCAAFDGHFVALSHADTTDSTYRATARSRDRIADLVDNGDFVWVARDAKHTDDLMRAFGFYFDPYGPRAPWFLIVEILSAVVAAVLAHVQESLGCAWTAWLAMAVAVVYAAVIVAVRPHRVPLDRVCYCAAAAYQALCGLGVAVVHTLENGTDNRDKAEAAVSLMLSLSAFAVVCLAVYEAFKVVYMQLIIRWRKLDARAAEHRRRHQQAEDQPQPYVFEIAGGADEDAVDASLLLQRSSGAFDEAIDTLLLGEAAEDPTEPSSFSPQRSGFLDALLNDESDDDLPPGKPKDDDDGSVAPSSVAEKPQRLPRAPRADDSRQHRMHDALHHALHTADIDAGATQMAAAFEVDDNTDNNDDERGRVGVSTDAHTLENLLTYDAYHLL